MKKTLFLLFCGAVYLAQGCATIMHGTKQDISIASDPPGAQAVINNNMTVTTPASVALSRKHTYDVQVSKPGYTKKTARIDKNFSAWYLINIPFFPVGGFIGLILDAVNGAMWNLDPEEVRVNLEAGEDSAVRPRGRERAEHTFLSGGP